MKNTLWNKNFNLIIAGQLFSIFANVVLQFCISLYILDITSSATLFAVISVLSIIPKIICSPFSGVIVDRFNKKKLMIFLDSAYGVGTVFLSFVVFWNTSLIALGFIMILFAIFSTLETPLTQSLIPLVQTDEQLVKANSIVSQIAMLSNIIGPILAGILYSQVDINIIFLICGLIFFTTALLEMQIKIPRDIRKKSLKFTSIIKEDFSVLCDFLLKEKKPLLNLMIIIACINLVGLSFSTIALPYLIRVYLQMDSSYYGFIQATLAVFGIIGAGFSSLVNKKLKVSQLYLLIGLAGFVVLLIAIPFKLGLSSMEIVIFMTALMVLVQMCFMILSIISITIIQTNTEKDNLGKVMSILTTFSLIAQPIGQIIYGALLESFQKNLWIVIIASGVLLILIGKFSKNSFKKLQVMIHQ